MKKINILIFITVFLLGSITGVCTDRYLFKDKPEEKVMQATLAPDESFDIVVGFNDTITDDKEKMYKIEVTNDEDVPNYYSLEINNDGSKYLEGIESIYQLRYVIETEGRKIDGLLRNDGQKTTLICDRLEPHESKLYYLSFEMNSDIFDMSNISHYASSSIDLKVELKLSDTTNIYTKINFEYPAKLSLVKTEEGIEATLYPNLDKYLTQEKFNDTILTYSLNEEPSVKIEGYPESTDQVSFILPGDANGILNIYVEDAAKEIGKSLIFSQYIE